MLPREPSGEYRIPSIAYYADHSLEGIPAHWSAAPARIIADLKTTYDAGIRAMAYETDFNFGKYGLAYYLLSKVLWNVNLTPAELDAIRDRWLQRSFGSGWREMKTYYDFMLLENYPVNAPAAWAKAIRLIDAADARIDPAAELDAQRRHRRCEGVSGTSTICSTPARRSPIRPRCWNLPGKGRCRTSMRCTWCSSGRSGRETSPWSSPNRSARARPTTRPKKPPPGGSGFTITGRRSSITMFADATLANGKPGRDGRSERLGPRRRFPGPDHRPAVPV